MASPQNSSPSNGRGTRTKGGRPTPRYEVLDRLGEGSLWIAYRVRDRSQVNGNGTGPTVTLKALKALPNRHPRLPGAFQSTLEAWQGLSHPALVTPLEVGIEENTLFFTSEYLPGTSLETHLGRGALAPDTTLAALRALLPPLRYLHEKGIAHGDVRPRQVLFDAGTHAKLTDGGLAEAFTTAGLSLVDLQNETAFYLAPELTPGAAPTPAADIYALGVLLYRMLTGRVPYDGVSTVSIAARHRVDNAMPPTQLKPRLDPKWDELTKRLLAKDPALRPTAAQLDSWLRGGTSGGARRNAGPLLPDAEIPSNVPGAEDESAPVAASASSSAVPPPVTVTPSEADERTVIIKGAPTAMGGSAGVATGAVVGVAAAGGAAGTATVGSVAADEGAVPFGAAAPTVGKTPRRRSLATLVEEELASQDEETRKKTIALARKRFRRREFWGALGALIFLLMLLGGAAGGAYSVYNYWVKNTPATVIVPAYVGKNQKDAQLILSKKGLMIRVVREAYDPKLPEGTVIAGEPEAGRSVRAKREVLVTVSVGPAPIKMVDFARLTLEQARQIITKHGLRLGQVIQQFDATPEGFVCGQFPEPGESLRRSEPITLIVSRGPQPTQIDAQAGTGDAEVPNPDDPVPPTPAPLDDDSSFAPLEPVQGGDGGGANGLVTRRATVRVKVPAADGTQVVRIVVRDANGERTVYQRVHRAGDRVSTQVSATRAQNDQALVRIYVGETLIKEEHL